MIKTFIEPLKTNIKSYVSHIIEDYARVTDSLTLDIRQVNKCEDELVEIAKIND